MQEPKLRWDGSASPWTRSRTRARRAPPIPEPHRTHTSGLADGAPHAARGLGVQDSGGQRTCRACLVYRRCHVGAGTGPLAEARLLLALRKISRSRRPRGGRAFSWRLLP